MPSDERFPRLLTGSGPLPEWLRQHEEEVRVTLTRVGAVMLRGFDVGDVTEFDRVRTALFLRSAQYVEGATPRRQLSEHVFTSTEFPATETIALHNENSYATTWPGVLLFCCLQPPASGGATPVADVRRVLARLGRPLVRSFVSRGGWMLTRTYSPWLGLGWRTAFGTQSRADVDEYCARSDVEVEWLDDDVLRTRQVRPVLARHPATGETVWFNHVRFWHPAFLPEESRLALEEEFGPDGLPYCTRYGDGSAVPDEVALEIDAAYEAEKAALPWEQGDVMLVDNMLAAHGRESFTGQRKVVVGMGEPVSGDAARVASPG